MKRVWKWKKSGVLVLCALALSIGACQNAEIGSSKGEMDAEEPEDITSILPPTEQEEAQGETPEKMDPNAKGCCGFPLRIKPLGDFMTGGRNYGARRSGGSRKHAGCDLLAKVDTPVYAIDDGTIIDVAPFYLGTDAIVVLHKGGAQGLKEGYVVRYGETRANGLAPGLKINSKVKRGQHIGYVGKLQGLKFAMVHFELYEGTQKGNLSVASGHFRRRGDLMDPTPFLKEWIKVFSNP